MLMLQIDVLTQALGRPRRLLTTRELSDYLNVPAGTLYTWRSNGDGPSSMKVGRHVRYRGEDVEAWLVSRTGHPRDRNGGDAP